MLGDVDYVGISVLVSSICAGVAAIISAVLSGKVHTQVSTNGDPRTLGQIASDVAKVTPGAEAPHGDH